MDILLLCTANQCRSPMAEGLLRRRLGDAGIDASVSSAGLLAGGAPATGHALRVLERRGIELSDHRSRRFDAELVARADLVVGMTREHVREVAVLDPAALARTFTLKELVLRGEQAGPRQPGEGLDAWLARVGAGRRAAELVGAQVDPLVDVADPIGGPLSGYERTAEEIDDLLARLVGLVWPDAVAERSA